jgi:hypothetical protein
MLEALFGAEIPLAVRFFLAFLIALGLIGATAWAVRRFGAGRLGGAGTRGRQPRLAVVDYASVRLAPAAHSRPPRQQALARAPVFLSVSDATTARHAATLAAALAPQEARDERIPSSGNRVVGGASAGITSNRVTPSAERGASFRKDLGVVRRGPGGSSGPPALHTLVIHASSGRHGRHGRLLLRFLGNHGLSRH